MVQRYGDFRIPTIPSLRHSIYHKFGMPVPNMPIKHGKLRDIAQLTGLLSQIRHYKIEHVVLDAIDASEEVPYGVLAQHASF